MLVLSVSDLKAQLSEQLRHVKEGETILITERGRPVARLVPVDPAERLDADMRALMEAGQIRPGTGVFPSALWDMDAPADPGAGARAALQQEREEGW